MKKIILLGPPGAGKGTQADLICKALSIPKISTGDMLRSAISAGNDLGLRVKTIMDSGALVSDDIILELVLERLAQEDALNGFLFDGVPRTIGQATLFQKNNIAFSDVCEIQVPDEAIVERMSGRRVHPASGRNYHILFNPPQNPGFDDMTGEPLIQRPDDEPETVLKRLEVYRDETSPLVDFYQNSELVDVNYFKVNGLQSVDAVFRDIKDLL
ncbi:MAG: adenylate kinase [Gammaproteobacteria bacterium]